ncbi:MAG: GYF domain-containing protein [Polyangiaceae bacterium]
MSSPRLSPPRTPIPPRPLSVPPTPITLPMTPVATLAPPSPMELVTSTPPLSRDWYVYQPDGRHIGPVSTWFLARGWVACQVPHDIYVGTAGEPQWRPLGQVEEIMNAVRALEAPTP